MWKLNLDNKLIHSVKSYELYSCSVSDRISTNQWTLIAELLAMPVPMMCTLLLVSIFMCYNGFDF